MKFRKSTKIIIAILIFSQGCSERKSNDPLFDACYKDAESKFLDCIDLGLDRYNQYFDLKYCDLLLKPETEKRFDANGINTDPKIWSASLKSTGFDSPNICGYSKKYVGHPDKPLFDKTIYDVISAIDTSIVLRNDTLHYEVDIRKTVIYFKCRNKFFEANMDIKIPESIKIAKTSNLYHREKIQSALKRLKEKYQ